jgi:hypothetical protein
MSPTLRRSAALLPFLLPTLLSCSGASQPSPSAAGVSAPFDVARVMRKVHFAFRADASGLSGGHTTYAAKVDARGGVTLVPYVEETKAASRSVEAAGAAVPSQGDLALPVPRRPGAPLELETVAIARGTTPLSSGPGAPELGDDGVALIWRADVVERLRNLEDGAEQTWTFARPPEGSGDLVVRVRAGGLAFRGESDEGLHFADGSGLGFRYGRATWVDGEGRASAVSARYEAGEIVLTVADDVVSTSAFPAVLDPVIGPETGVDEPIPGAGAGRQILPDLAFDGTSFLVVWSDYRSGASWDVYGARVGEDGTVLDAAAIAITTAAKDQQSPQVAFDGANFLVVWTDYRNGTVPDVYGARVSPGGTVLDANGIPIATGTSYQGGPAVAFAGGSHLVVWDDNRGGTYDVYGARVSPAGAVLDPDGIAICAAVRDQFTGSVASDGAAFLVAWADYRSGTSHDIYGTRLSPAGAVLDPAGIAISVNASQQYFPSVTFGETSYFVVWQDGGSGPMDVYGARVTTGGAVLDPAGIRVSSSIGQEVAPDVAFDGNEYLVVWYDNRSSTFDIYGSRVSADGTLLDPGGLPISTGARSDTAAAVAAGTSGFLAAWQGETSMVNDGTYMSRVVDGTVTNPGGKPVSPAANDQRNAAVSFDGTSYLVVWEDYRAGSADVYGARVGADGVLLDANGIAISTASGTQSTIAATFDGTNHLVVWSDSRSGASSSEIYGARVSPAGAVLDPAGIAIATGAPGKGAAAIASNGTVSLAVWTEWRGSGTGYDLYAARVSAAGTVLTPSAIPLSTASRDQNGAAVASDGTSFLVVWEDLRNDATYFDVYGARVTAAGDVLDANGFAISTAASVQSSPAVAYGGGHYLAAWMDARDGGGYDIRGARVSTAGAALDPGGIVIGAAVGEQYRPAVAHDGNDHVVVWYDTRNGNADIFGARVTAAGIVSDPNGIPIATAPKAEFLPAIESDGEGRSLVAYGQQLESAPNNGADRIVTRILTTGTMVLTVVKAGSGSGTVTSSPPAIDCGAACSATLDLGTEVTLTAVPTAGSRFDGWSGACTGTAACTVTMDQARSVTATFVAVMPLTVAKAGSGGGAVTSSPAAIDCGSTCDATLDLGTEVTLTVVPAAGSRFDGWSGACTGTAACTVTMDQARSVTATFALVTSAQGSASGGGGCSSGAAGPVALLGLAAALGLRRRPRRT